MDNSTNLENSGYQIGLNIHFLAFGLPNKLIRSTDQIKICFTTFPEGEKNYFQIKGKLMDYSNQIFSFNITNKTEKIIMDINKKTFFNEGPVIATAIIYLKKFVKLPIKEITNGTTISNVKSLDIFNTIQKDNNNEAECNEKLQNQEIEKKQSKKKIIHQMEIQLSFTTPFQNSDLEEAFKEKKKNSKKFFIKN